MVFIIQTNLTQIIQDINPVSNSLALFRLRSYFKKNKFDIVHTHSSAAGILGRIAARLAGVPVIIHTVHGWGLQEGMNFFKKQLYIFLERLCGKFTDKLVVVSKVDIEKGLEYKIGNRSKYAVIYSGIDIKKFSKTADTGKKRKELGLKETLPVVGMIGRLDVQKNPLDFVRAAAEIQKQFRNVQFVIVGDGPLRKQAEELVKELKIQNFRLLGFRDDVDEIIHTFDISVMTSLWEGLPRVFPESMAAKKPIVATNVDGAKEAIVEGVNGFRVETHRPEKVAEKVLYLLKNPRIAREMGEKGYAMVEKFSLSKMLQDIEDLYEKLIKYKNTSE